MTRNPLGILGGPVRAGVLGIPPKFRDPETHNFPPGSYSWQPTHNGRWTFYAWSQGGGGSSTGPIEGGSGAYGEITKALTVGQRVTIDIGTDTTLTFPDGTVATLTGGSGVTPGAASGFDYQLAGSAPGTDGQGTGGGTSGGNGGGAPGRLPHRGGSSTSANGGTPGAGGGSSPVTSFGGQGLVLAEYGA